MEEFVLAIGDIIVGVDIGTSKISAVVGEINSFNQVEIVATAECKCFGMKKSKITDEEEVAAAITKTISEIEQVANIKINSAYATIPGKYITIVQNSIVKEAKDRYAGISTKDVTSAILQVRDIDIPEDKVLIDISASEFSLDNGRVIDDPVGSLSSSFTVKGQVILADKNFVKQLTNVFRKAGIEIGRFFQELAKMLPSLVLPAIAGVVIMLFAPIHGYVSLLLFILLFVAVFFVSVWLFAMNKEEKALACKLTRKYQKRERG